MNNFQRIIGAMHRAIDDYKMIEDGDKIAVGVSGGKDSLCLLKALSIYKKFAKQKFEIIAVMIDLFNGQYEHKEIENFCNDLEVKLHIENSSINEIVFQERKEKNPCSLCAKMRRGMLNSCANKLGCNKVALAHHGDDLMETFFLSLIYEGRLSTFSPVSYLSETHLEVIRPFIYVEENMIMKEEKHLPVFKNPCVVDHKTEREKMKNLIKNLEIKFPNSKKNIFNSITKTERYNLLNKCKK